MKRVADILAEELARLGLEQVFMITGGGAMHLNDAFGRCKELKIFFNHHEQASAMAAEAYARIAGKPAIVNVTTGPGGINAMNGVFGAYTDSIPMVVISGQIKRDTMIASYAPRLRQLGDQEVDIISLVRPITKYAVELQDPFKIKEVISKALFLATHGRPGPVWIDVPMDIQGCLVDETTLTSWVQDQPNALQALRGDRDLNPVALGDFCQDSDNTIRKKCRTIIAALKRSRRPVFLAGSGVRLSGTRDTLLQLAEHLGLPLVGGWGSYDLVPTSHPCYAGRPGTVGDRPGNFTVQNADFLLTLGCRLNIRQVSYNWEGFAPKAWKAQVDIDPSELAKPTLRNDLSVTADVARFLSILEEELKDFQPEQAHKTYLEWCRARVQNYPVVNNQHRKPGKVNPYHFVDQLYEHLSADDIVVMANGAASVIGCQAGRIQNKTRLVVNSGNASMGYDLPGAIGAALAAGGRRVICLAGDGSIMMNVQELSSIVGEKLPIHIFLLNNNGYLSIRQTQLAYFPDNMLGIDKDTGVHFPEFAKMAMGFGLTGCKIELNQDVPESVSKALAMPIPALHEVLLDQHQNFEPKTASKKLPDGSMVTPPLEDMAPFLSREELGKNILTD